MVYLFIVFFVFILLVLILTLSVSIGHRFGCARLKKHPDHKLEIDGIAESAVFGLLALLIAFSFSGAYDRLEHRKLHLLKEANAFSTAYDYIDLLSPKFYPSLRENIRQYLDLHLAAYNEIPYNTKVDQVLSQAKEVESKIWKTAITGCEENPNKSLFILVIPAMDEMFRIAHTGINMAKVHPPAIVFVLLIGLAMAGAFLIGYNSANKKQRRPFHMICYVLLTAFTIYIIINIEYPRSGFIRLQFFDQVLINIRDNMQGRLQPPPLLVGER